MLQFQFLTQDNKVSKSFELLANAQAQNLKPNKPNNKA